MAICGAGNRFTSHIVHRRTQPARSEDDFGTFQSMLDHVGDALFVVADRRGIEEIETYRAQLLCDVRAIRVYNFAE